MYLLLHRIVALHSFRPKHRESRERRDTKDILYRLPLSDLLSDVIQPASREPLPYAVCRVSLPVLSPAYLFCVSCKKQLSALLICVKSPCVWLIPNISWTNDARVRFLPKVNIILCFP